MAKEHPPPIYIISGGTGASAEQVVHTVLAQFHESSVSITSVRLSEAVAWREAGLMLNLPEGWYTVTTRSDKRSYSADVYITNGSTTWLEFVFD